MSATTTEYLTLRFTSMMASILDSGFQNILKSDHIVIPKMYLCRNLTNYEAHYPHHYVHGELNYRKMLVWKIFNA